MSKRILSLVLAVIMLFGVVTSSGITAFAADGASNYPLNSIVIKLEDIVTHQMLGGGRFEIYYNNQAVSGGLGTLVATVDTDGSGVIVISGIPSGYYTVRQTVPPNNYHLSITNEQHIYIKPDGTSIEELVFSDYRYGGLVVILTDKDTGKPVGNATFSVSDVNNKAVGNSADGVYTTDSKGEFYLENLPAGDYKITQLTAAQGYALDSSPNMRTIRLQHTNADQSVFRATFENSPLGSLLIRLKDKVSKEPLAGAVFNIKISGGADLGEFTTNAQGTVLLPKIVRGTYIITQISAPASYLLATTAKTQYVNYVQTYAVDFENSPKSGLHIVKIDADTKTPLKDAKFNVYKDSTILGTYTTNADGAVVIPNLEPGWYTVSEYAAPQGYVLDDTPQSVQVTSEQLLKMTFEDKKLASLQIVKTDEYSGAPLTGAKFHITTQAGIFVADVTTDASGKASVPGVTPGWYVIAETKAPDGYQLSETAKTVEVKVVVPTVVTITNKPLSGIEILKTDANSGAPLQGAVFTIERTNGERIGKYTTDVAGKIIAPYFIEGVYIISEVKAPDGYILDVMPQTVNVKSGKLTVAEFANTPLPNLYIKKVDATTGALLAGAEFSVAKQNAGESRASDIITNVTSISNGAVVVPRVQPGIYVITETKAPVGYELNDPVQTVEVLSNGSTIYKGTALTGNIATFANKPLNTLEIVKLDSVTHNPLSGAMFDVTKANGEKIGSYRTDSSGKILVTDVSEGTYVISETAAPSGYILNESPKSVNIKGGKLVSVEFLNKPLSGIEIVKLDAVSHKPLQGAAFTVIKADGERIGNFKTEADGKVIISDLDEGVYVVGEITAPDGYQLDETPKNVTVKSGKLAMVEFTNKPYSGIQIVKTDAVSHKPLSGATFEVVKTNGEKISTLKTDVSGKAIVNDLTEGDYIVSETIAPDGYILDSAPQTVTVKSGKLTTVEFTNKPLAGLKIVKLDSATRQPIAGVEFAVSKMDGERVENDFRANTFKTDSAGQIYIPELADGYYTVTEIKQADGYILDSEPKNVLIKSGKNTVLEVLNTPMSGLLIVKTDEATKKPLKGVVFDVKHADGQFVAGSILDENQPNTVNNSPSRTTSENGDITGSYTTDANGRIQINGLAAGQYNVIERKALDGYELDTEVHSVTVTPGKLATLQVTNRQKAGLRLQKIDSVTKKGIYNVEFIVFDSNNKVVGNYITDNNGVIDFTGILTEGRYTIRETRPAPGYYNDDVPRTVEFKSGKVTEIVWENTPQMGQIQIMKKSGDDNEVNGLPKGTPLSGAIFEIYNYKSGNLVDRFTSGSDGRAVSKPLPIGRYTVKEVQAPKWYKLSSETLDIDVEFATQIIKREFLNYSANTGVKIRKVGPYETMPGNPITYNIKEIGNTSTVPLTDFFWRDIVPTSAARLTKIVTGTYNQSLKYKVVITTNKGDTRVIADNLSTTTNNVIDCRNAALGLANDEYVTSFSLIFGTVKAGFTKVTEPQVFMSVKKGLSNGYQFANKCDVGGKYGSEWVVGASSWVTQVFAKPIKLPNTGY